MRGTRAGGGQTLGDMLKYHDMAFPKDEAATGHRPSYSVEARASAVKVALPLMFAAVRYSDNKNAVTSASRGPRERHQGGRAADRCCALCVCCCCCRQLLTLLLFVVITVTAASANLWRK